MSGIFYLLTSLAFASEIGEKAPDFKLSSLDNKEVSLADFKGKTVVLEWFNPGCPFVKGVHKDGEMKKTANYWMDKDVVWLAINSGKAGKQGTGLEKNTNAKKDWGLNYPILIDEKGTVGKAYGAKTTPQMFVIDTKGTLVYKGAYDNDKKGKKRGEEGHEVYVSDALKETLAGKKVSTSETKPYGCSVKY